MIILFPKRKGVKIATTLIFEAMEQQRSAEFILGMISFALSFGAISQDEARTLKQYLEERGF